MEIGIFTWVLLYSRRDFLKTPTQTRPWLFSKIEPSHCSQKSRHLTNISKVCCCPNLPWEKLKLTNVLFVYIQVSRNFESKRAEWYSPSICKWAPRSSSWVRSVNENNKKIFFYSKALTILHYFIKSFLIVFTSKRWGTMHKPWGSLRESMHWFYYNKIICSIKFRISWNFLFYMTYVFLAWIFRYTI